VKQIFAVGLIVAGLLVAMALPAFSQSPGSIDVLVTPEVLSVSLGLTDIDYDSLPMSASDGTRSVASSPAISVTNTGSVTADLMIQGSDAQPSNQADATWTLSCDPSDLGTVAQDQFVHRFVLSPNDFNSSSAKALCPDSPQDLASNLAPQTGSVDFRLQINMPTSTTGYSQRTSTVTVTAMKH
jgi:hypothetical protein